MRRPGEVLLLVIRAYSLVIALTIDLYSRLGKRLFKKIIVLILGLRWG
jgi:hypothetical protein